MEAAIAKALQQAPAAQLSDEESEDYGSSGEEEELAGDSSSDDGESGDEPGGTSGDEELDGAADDDFDAAAGSEEEEEEGDDGGQDPGSSGGEEGGSESEGEEGGGRQQAAAKRGFLEGGKADAFAKAFSRILEKAEKKKGGEAAAEEAPILAGSKSIAKRKAEVEQSAQHDREAKRLRMEMKQRGHVVPTKRGQDPTADVREKGLQRLATRGVVKLFNAIAKAQKQLKEAQEQTGSKAKAAKVGRASFLAELKGAAAGVGAAKGAGGDQLLVPSAPGQAAAAAAQRQLQQKQQLGRQQQAAGGGSSSEEEGDAGWEVLQQGFAGLQGGNKMKDWDKQVSEDEEGGGEEMDDSEDQGSGDDEW